MEKFSSVRIFHIIRFYLYLSNFIKEKPNPDELDAIFKEIDLYCEKEKIEFKQSRKYDEIRLFMYEELRKYLEHLQLFEKCSCKRVLQIKSFYTYLSCFMKKEVKVGELNKIVKEIDLYCKREKIEFSHSRRYNEIRLFMYEELRKCIESMQLFEKLQNYEESVK